MTPSGIEPATSISQASTNRSTAGRLVILWTLRKKASQWGKYVQAIINRR